MKKHLLKLLLLCCIGILTLGLLACVPTTEQYKLEFIVEGEAYYSQTTNGYSRITPPEDPTREGYSFVAWYLDEACTEEFFAYSFEQNPIKGDTKVYAKWKESDFHTCVASDWMIETNATCKDEGTQIKICVVDYCKKVLETKAIPISEKHASTYTAEIDYVPATCKAEGSYISATYCSLCNRQTSAKTVKIEIDKNAHGFEDGVLVRDGDSFSFVANCSICNENVSLTNVEVETEILIAPTCTTEGLIRYIYPHLGGAVTAEETVSALGHTVAGVAIEDTKVYSEITHREVLAKVDLYVNSSSCTEVVDGLFLCEACDTYCNIKVNKPHVGDWASRVEPTCYMSGEEILDYCTACAERWIIRAVAPTGEHVYLDGDIALDKVGDKFNLVTPCVNACYGCTASTIIRKDVPTTSAAIVSDNCQAPDIIRYTFNYMGKPAVYDVVTCSGHFLNGVRASTIADEEGWFHYSLITPTGTEGGIKIFADRVLECEEKLFAYYNCSCCGELVDVEVYRPHSGSWTVEKASTCTVNGVKRFNCDFCDYTETDSLELIDHDYSWKLVIDADADSTVRPFALEGTCYCGQGSAIKNVLVTTNISSRPTCHSEGEIIYSHTYDGNTYYLAEKIPMTDHSIDGTIVNTKAKFDYAEYVVSGKIKIHAGQTVVCDPNATSLGFFICSECEELINVNVYRVHSGEIVEELSPDSTACVKVGTKHLDCVYDGCEGEDLGAINEKPSHVYNVDIAVVGNAHTVTLTCTVDGCGNVEVYTEVAAVNITVITLATCCEEGVVEYSFTSGDESYVIVNNIGKGDHMLHGVDYKTLMDADGKLSADLEGLRIISDTHAAFECEACKHLVEVEIKSDEE